MSEVTTKTGFWNIGPQDTIDTAEILNHTHKVEIPAGVPAGCIMYWDLSNGPIPSGWKIYTPLLGRYALGDSNGNGETVAPGLPNITATGFYDQAPGYSPTKTGALYYADQTEKYKGSGDTDSDNRLVGFDASRCSTIYGNSTTVRPASVKLVPIIKQ